MLFHDSQMNGITRRQSFVSLDNLLGALRRRSSDIKDLIDDSQQGIKRWLDGVPAADRDIAMQNLLQDLSISDEALAIAEKSLKQSLRVTFVGVGRAHQIHGNVRIDQNHLSPPEPYPISISASMRSISAVG